jgi:uncharacterized membrane protein required for colicin V production
MVDLAALLIIVLSAIRGFLRGALLSFLALVALVAAFLASGPLGPIVARLMLDREGWTVGTAGLVGRLVAGACIYALLLVGAHLVARKVGRTREGRLRPWNRNLGLLGGLLSGAILVLILVFLVDLGLKVSPNASGVMVRSARRSVLRRMVSPINPADRFAVTDALRVLRAAQQDPQVLKRLRQDPAVREVLEHPDMKPLLQDRELADAIRAYNVEAVFSNDNVRRAMGNPELRRQITSPRVRAALQRAMQRRPRGESQRGP